MNRRSFLGHLSVSPALLAQQKRAAPAAPKPPAAAPDDWARWRGPFDTGVARTSAPLEWSDSKGILWKAPVPGRGFSSPVLWGDQIFVTTAVPTGPAPAAAAAPAPQPPPGGPPPGGGRRGPGGFGGGGGPQAPHRFAVMGFDRRSGKLLWEQTATEATPHEGHHPKYGSFASNSPVTDGKLLYSSFGSRGYYAYDLSGKLAWKKDFGVKMKMLLGFGEGVAPVLDGNTLLALFDQEEGSFMAALDTATGAEKWRVERQERTNWAQPLVVTHDGRKQIIVAATSKVRCYDFADGKLIWECAGLGRNTIPHPVYYKGLAIVMSGYQGPNMLAIKMGRTGDLTGTDAVVWTNQRGNPYTPAPILYQDKLYFLTDTGLLSCFNPENGQPFYHQQRLPKAYNFKSSPVVAGDRIYLSSEEGDVIVCRTGEKFEVLATNTLTDEFFVATPAVAGGQMYLRGKNTLHAIGG